MTVTLSGTYTHDNGQSPASGTVVITPFGESPTTYTLDETGAFSTTMDQTKAHVVETINGVVLASDINAVAGQTVSLSKNVGGASGNTNPIKIGGVTLTTGTGVPAIAGVLGDRFWRTDGAAGTSDYVCTTAGVAGSAVWTAIT